MLSNFDDIFLNGVYLPYYRENVEPLEEECCNLSLKTHNTKDLFYRLFKKSRDKRRLKELEKLYNKRLEILSQLSNRYYFD